MNPVLQKHRDEVRQMVDDLEVQLRNFMEGDEYQKFLNTMARFPHYSLNNTLLISLQCPNASYVCGAGSWQQNFERTVLPDARGIRIIAPFPRKQPRTVVCRDPETGEVLRNDKGKALTKTVYEMRPDFRVIRVFDISETEGKELPLVTSKELNAPVADFSLFWNALREISPVPITVESLGNEQAYGYYDVMNRCIVLRNELPPLQQLKTAVHEIAHAKLHSDHCERNRHQRETEAESIAYTVWRHFGLDTSEYSFPYLSSWAEDHDTKTLRASLETIRTASAQMIDALEESLQRQREQEHLRESTVVWALPSLGLFVEAEPSAEHGFYAIYDSEYHCLEKGQTEKGVSSATELAQSVCQRLSKENPASVADHRAFRNQVQKAALSPQEASLEQAVWDVIKEHQNIPAGHVASVESHRFLQENYVRIYPDFVAMKEEPIFSLHRESDREPALPTLRYIRSPALFADRPAPGQELPFPALGKGREEKETERNLL